MRKILFSGSIIFLLTLSLTGQEKQKVISAGGYITSMQSAIFDSVSGPFIFDNLLHNRINLKGTINDHLTFAAEFRNRLFTGDMARNNLSYPGYIGSDAGLADMSWNIVKQPSFFLNVAVDRLWVDYNYDKLQVRLGRQRINWGQALIWNPNDIFNAYSFFDFDYVERPGSDAVRIQYYPNSTSTAEAAIKSDHDGNITAAGLYRFNKWGYDIQFLAGYMDGRDLVAGTGWSGSLGNFSFRGEASWYRGITSISGSESDLLVTAGIDRIFKDNSMAQLQVMYASSPMQITDFNALYSASMSPKNLAFSKFSAFTQFTLAATPLINAGVSGMWFPDLKGYFAGPSFDYSIAENLDFSLLWQHFKSVIQGKDTRINLVFLRIRYSY